MLNLQFILRSKRYYKMEPAAIYAQLIPVNYKLKKEEITALNKDPCEPLSQARYGADYYKAPPWRSGSAADISCRTRYGKRSAHLLLCW